MSSLYQLKPAFQNLLRPAARGLYSAGATANHVTTAAAFLSLAYSAALLASGGHLLLWLGLPLLLLVRMALNALDGMLAREWGQQSRLGAFLNELCDVLSDSALVLAFLAVPGVNVLLVAAWVATAALTEMAGVVSQALGASRRYDGPFGKSDRAFAQGVLAVGLGLGWLSSTSLNGALALAVALSALTAANRVRRSLREQTQL